MLYNHLTDLVGNTPIIKLNRINKGMADIYVKLERYNPGGSIKDRAALNMIEYAENEGLLKEGYTIVEPTSGNTGIALAMFGVYKGYNVVIVMPENMSKERQKIIKSFGANLILTDASNGMKGAIDAAYEFASSNKNIFIPQQFKNNANVYAHYKTAKEIINDVPDIDYFVAGIGTGGTISGVAKKLKEYKKDIKIIGIEPETSAVISGNESGPHKIQGIGAGFIPDILDKGIIDEIVTVSNDEAYEYARKMTSGEGIFSGISTGANVAICVKLSLSVNNNIKIVTVSPDGGEKYLSTELYD